MKQFYTYLHRDHDGQVFYIGCATTNPMKRGTRAKMQRAYATSGHSEAWHAKAKSGYSVEIVNVFETKQKAFDDERRLIAFYRANSAPLVNICAGGPGMPGAKDSEEVRRKKSITKIGALNPMHGKTGARHPQSRLVIHTGYGVFFDSVSDAADHFGIKMKTLYNMLAGHNRNVTSLEFA